MRSCGYRYVRKYKEINNSEQYIYLEISLDICCLDKSKVAYSRSRGYFGRSGKGITTSLNISNRCRSKNKQNAMTATTDISLKCFV